MPKKSLLDDDDEQNPSLDIKVNQEFAKRFQHNKERQEREKLEAKYPKFAVQRMLKERGGDFGEEEDEEDSSSSDDDEDDEAVLEELAQPDFLQALVRIKNKDPALYQSDVRLFNEEDEEEGEDEEEDGKQKKGKK